MVLCSSNRKVSKTAVKKQTAAGGPETQNSELFCECLCVEVQVQSCVSVYMCICVHACGRQSMTWGIIYRDLSSLCFLVTGSLTALKIQCID